MEFTPNIMERVSMQITPTMTSIERLIMESSHTKMKGDSKKSTPHKMERFSMESMNSGSLLFGMD